MGVRLEEMADLPFSWRSVKSSDSGIVFMIKPNFNLNTCSYQLDVFDGSKLWREVMHKDEFFERCKELNPKVEAGCSYLFDKIKSRCEELDTARSNKVELIRDEITVKIHLRLRLPGGIPFMWTFALSEESSLAYVSKEMILPLLTIIGELGDQRRELCRIIEKKDREIQDYKDQGVTVSRRNFETAPFKSSEYIAERLESKKLLDAIKDPLNVFSETTCQELFRSVLHEARRVPDPKFSTTLVMASSIGATSDTTDISEGVQPQALPSSIPLQCDPQENDVTEHTRREVIAKRLARKASRSAAKRKKSKMLNL